MSEAGMKDWQASGRRRVGKRAWTALIPIALACPGAATAADCIEDGGLRWRVEGGFTVFRGDEARRAGDRVLDAIAAHSGDLVDEDPNVGTAYVDLVRLLVDDGGGSETPLYARTYWDRAAGRYLDADELLRPDAIPVLVSRAGGGAGLCTWSVDGTAVQGACGGVRLVVPRRADTGEVRAVVRVADGSTVSATACIVVRERLIVGLGDSYASGEGNPDRPTKWSDVPAIVDAGTSRRKPHRVQTLWNRNRKGPLATASASADAQWWDNDCHRSLLSQQALAAMAFAARDRRRAVTFLSFACSGATVVDGIVGPRFEAPGVTRLPRHERDGAVAVSRSQITQAVEFLCRNGLTTSPMPVPAGLPIWAGLKRGDGRTPDIPSVPSCAEFRRLPDALLLSVGGNDVGFGGVGYWAIVPPADRGPLPIDLVANSSMNADKRAAKRDFGLVCPFRYGEKRCRRSGFTADELLGELPGVYRYMDAALARSGLNAARAKIHMSYPPVSRDQDGELCGKLWRAQTRSSHETQIEPWMPLYGEVLDTFRIGRLSPAALRGQWSFGIFNQVSAADCDLRREAELDVAREMCVMERDVYRRLNAEVARHAGWTVIPADRLPLGHGLCAASAELARAMEERPVPRRDLVGDLARREFGWPRYDRGWLDAWPSPLAWRPYAQRPRWFRTATDSALTQTVLDGGTGSPRPAGARTEAERHEENASGTIHPTLQMHAAMAELLAAELERGD